MKKYLFLILLLSVFSCKNKKNENIPSSVDFTVKIGISGEPRALCPVKRNSIIERQINQYIFLQAADYNPFTLNNIPVFIENIPNEIVVDTGKYKGSFRYDLTFRKEAKWDNGTPVTAFDQLFILKLILNPQVEVHPVVRNLYKKLKGIEINPNNPRKVSIYTEKNYMLSKEMVTNMEIFPEYFYDPQKTMRKIPFEDFLNEKKINSILDTLTGAKELAEKMNSVYYMRQHISGQGPYYLSKWETGNFVVLKRKKNYWGQSFNDIPYLQSNPKEIIFKVIADKTTALTELKNGNIDVLQGVSSNEFLKMKNDSVYKTKFDFQAPLTMRSFYIVLNNRNPILKDKNIRKALAHLTDVDFLIKTFGTGKEKRLTSSVHPSKSYFNKSLKPIRFSIEKAKQLLTAAGWTDTDNNGIRDKILNGKKTELTLRFVAKGKGLGKSIGLLLRENAAKAGVDIQLISKGSKEFRKVVKSRNFDLIPTVLPQDLADIDPYWDWHSDNTVPGGSNISGFSNDKCDSIIEKIRSSRDEKKRSDYYQVFQTIIYEEQPVIFLFVPTNNIIVSNKFKIKTSIKRPGYFANTFELRQNQ